MGRRTMVRGVRVGRASVGSRQITIEIPDDLYERLVAASRDAGASLDATIADLVGRGLNRNGSHKPERVDIAARRRELQRIREALGSLVEHPQPREGATSSVFDPQTAAEFRAGRPVLDPPISQTIIEDRADRI